MTQKKLKSNALLLCVAVCEQVCMSSSAMLCINNYFVAVIAVSVFVSFYVLCEKI